MQHGDDLKDVLQQISKVAGFINTMKMKQIRNPKSKNLHFYRNTASSNTTNTPTINPTTKTLPLPSPTHNTFNKHKTAHQYRSTKVNTHYNPKQYYTSRNSYHHSHSQSYPNVVKKRKRSNSTSSLETQRETKKPKDSEYCKYFNKSGKCDKPNCRFIHDITKISVCKNFAKTGKCEIKNCPLQHSFKSDQELKPVCRHFLRGSCMNDACQFAHVNVNQNSEICINFQKGLCLNPEKCNLKHTNDCQEYYNTGVCSKTPCPNLHKYTIVKSAQPLKEDPKIPDVSPLNVGVTGNIGSPKAELCVDTLPSFLRSDNNNSSTNDVKDLSVGSDAMMTMIRSEIQHDGEVEGGNIADEDDDDEEDDNDEGEDEVEDDFRNEDEENYNEIKKLNNNYERKNNNDFVNEEDEDDDELTEDEDD